MADYSFSMGNGELQIEGVPIGSKAYIYKSVTTNRMIRIRMGLKLLSEARDALDQLSENSQNIIIAESISHFAGSRYASCFQKGGALAPHLNAKKVYKGNQDALERHREWMRIRNEHFNHINNTGFEFCYVAIFNEYNSFHDGVSLCLHSPISQSSIHMHFLYKLICETLTYLDNSAEQVWKKIKSEVESLSESDLASLPPATIKKPKYP